VRKYSKPTLSGHKVLYNSPRYCVFEISKDFPYNGFEENSSFIIYDGVFDTEIAWCTVNESGEFRGKTPYGPHELDVYGSTIRDLIDNVQKKVEWIIRN
jgi:hypothetical protein